MQLTVLGCWAPYPRPGEACSGYLLQSGATALMLEVGHGSFSHLTKHINYRQLSGLVITHYHPDHYADIYCLRHAIEGARRDGRMAAPIKLFIPPAPVEIYRQLADYTRAFCVINVEELPTVKLCGAKLVGTELHENEMHVTDSLTAVLPRLKQPANGLSECEKLQTKTKPDEELSPKGTLDGVKVKVAQLNELTLYFIPTMHALPGYAVLARQGERSFFFSGDTAPTPDIAKAAGNVELLLCEASGLDKDASYLSGAHMTARQAGELARQAKAERLVITHFWPEYNVQDLLAQARESFGGAVLAAKQDAIFKWP